MLKEGDFVRIPLTDGRAMIGRILHVSQHFKDAIGFMVYGPEDAINPSCLLTLTANDFRCTELFYTHAEALPHYGVTVIANRPLSEEEKLLTLRDVGGGAYVGDDFVGASGEIDVAKLKPMIGSGMPVIHIRLAQAFPET